MKKENSLIYEMLRTPQQVQQEQLEKIRERSLKTMQARQANLSQDPIIGALQSGFADAGARAARILPEQRAAYGKAAGGLLSAASGLGVDPDNVTEQDQRRMSMLQNIGRDIERSQLTPEAQEAAKTQDILKQAGQVTDAKDPEQYFKVASNLERAGRADLAELYLQRGLKLEASQAKTGTDKALIAQRLAKAGLSNVEADRVAQLTPFEQGKLVSQIETEKAKTRKALAAAGLSDQQRAQIQKESDVRVDKLIADAEESRSVVGLNVQKGFTEEAKQLKIFQDGRLSAAQAALVESTTDLEVQKKEKELIKLSNQINNIRADTQYTIEQKQDLIATREERLNVLRSQVGANRAKMLEYDANAIYQTERTNTEIALRPAKVAEGIKKVDELSAKIAKINNDMKNDDSITDADLRLAQAEYDKTMQETLLLSTKTDFKNKELELLGKFKGPAALQMMQAALDSGSINQEEFLQFQRNWLESKTSVEGSGGVNPKLARAYKAYDKNIEMYDEAPTDDTVSLSMLRALPYASTGQLASLEEIAVSIGSLFNIPEAKRQRAADELIDVLKGKLTLDEAQNMSGALSDKDIQFLKEAVGGRNLTPQVFREVLTQHYIAAKVAQVVPAKLYEQSLKLTSNNMDEFNAYDYRKKLEKVAKVEAKELLIEQLGLAPDSKYSEFLNN